VDRQALASPGTASAPVPVPKDEETSSVTPQPSVPKPGLQQQATATVAPSLQQYLDTAFTEEWAEQWFKGTCETRSHPGHDCLFEPVSAISKGEAGGDDAWSEVARAVLIRAADSAKRVRPGSDYRARCNASGCILVFATPLPGPFLKREDLPGFEQQFSDTTTRISWMGCPGCWNTNLDVVVVARNSAAP